MKKPAGSWIVSENYGKVYLILMLAALALLATLFTAQASVKNRGRDRSGPGLAPVKPATLTPAANNKGPLLRNWGMNGEIGPASRRTNESPAVAAGGSVPEISGLITAADGGLSGNNPGKGSSRILNGSNLSSPGWISINGNAPYPDVNGGCFIRPGGGIVLSPTDIPHYIVILDGIVIPLYGRPGSPLIIIGGWPFHQGGPGTGNNDHDTVPNPVPLFPSLYFLLAGLAAISANRLLKAKGGITSAFRSKQSQSSRFGN